MRFFSAQSLLSLLVNRKRDKDVSQQMKQATDTTARLQDELRQAEDRERQLQVQLDKMKLGVSKSQPQQKEFDDRPAKQNDRESNILVFSVSYFQFITTPCPEKRSHSISKHNFNRCRRSFVIFGMNHPEDLFY